MKKKVFLLVALAATMISGLKAQESRPISVRLTAGAGVSRIAYGLQDDKFLPGLRAGVSVDIPFQDVLSFRPTLLAVTKGDYAADLPVGKATVRPLYIEMPLYLNVYMPYSKNTVWYANLGPYVAYGVAGKYKPNSDALDQKEHKLFESKSVTIMDDEKEKDGSLLNTWDAGLSGNLGVEFNHFIVEMGMEVGMMNTANELKDPSTVPGWVVSKPKNFNVSGHLSIGWRF